MNTDSGTDTFIARRNELRDPTPYEAAILHGMLKPVYIPGVGYRKVDSVYQGYCKIRVVTDDVDGSTFVIPDPREAQTARRRARNRVARRSRRVNRIRGAR